MAQAGKTFRIFVSSTFSDLKVERNALQKYVFPRLRELCMQHGCRFQAIDLRWGVSEEAGLDQQTVKICLQEIKLCQKTTPRPNFIVLLGDRYGWRPLPAEIPEAEYEEIERRVVNPDDQALLKAWYRRDDNAVPAVYCLQARTGDFTDYARWHQVERRLHAVLLQSTTEMTLEAGERVKYSASATEQEIVCGALGVQDAQEHVFCFFRQITNRDDLINDLPLPLRAIARGFETLIEDITGRLMALFPEPLNYLTTHPSGRLWVGASGNHVYLIALEGS